MKKNILLCLVGYLCLCLPTNTLTAQVADSPGADFLHRSQPQVSPEQGDTHRGGETRSDTLPEDGSLVDHSGLPADNRIAKLAVHDNVAGIQGQEGESSSAAVGEGLPAVIHVETMSVHPIDSLEFRIWDPYLNELDVPKPYIEHVSLSNGSVFEGSWGAKKAQWTSPPLSGYARVTIRNGMFKYLDRFLVEPGDSVRIRLDFQTGNVLFSGPAAEKFRCQFELAQAIEMHRFGQDPIMFTGESDYWGHSEEDSIRIAKAKASNSSIRPTIQFVSPDESGMEYLKQGFSKELESHRAWEVIDNFEGRLPTDFWQILIADLLGKLQYDQLKHFLYLRLGLEDNPSYRQLYQDRILEENYRIPEGAAWSVYFIDYLYQKLSIISYMEKEPMANFLTSIPETVRDPVYAKYLIKNFRTFNDSNSQFEKALDILQTPWISELIRSLYHSQRIGAPIASIPLTNAEGDSVVLKGDDGKIRLIQFWLPGCQASASYYERLLSPVVSHFKGDPEVEFVFISNDNQHERWLKNISSEKYSSKVSINLNAPGKTHPFLMYYHIHAFPEQMVIGRDGGVTNLGNIPKTPQGLIEYLDSLKETEPSSIQPLVK
ncbi:TlpA family protein disulfide reductase [Algoriphagus sp. NG3]|uniref:TlpA family protein disulfide reductase n=1 Tax=Algoriphagus sp. NG3 TaxID=3097546 RepID=UPI002A80AA49|nr:thioredoxin-like domain-containing protein [Algoriphagus sp. NG3]WPR77502.1 thioredoxin-like domain-containing protein [Algoriphagus sp. NG3]